MILPFRTVCTILVLVTCVQLGCSTRKRTVYLDDAANFGAVETVAILPFDNFTNDPHASEKVAQILMIELLSAEAFNVIDPGESRQAMLVSQVSTIGELTTEGIGAIGQRLEAQALFVGTVQEIQIDRTAGVTAPTVSLHFELLDVGTGETIWSSVVSRQGAGASARLFGIGGKSVNEAIRELVRSALDSLIR